MHRHQLHLPAGFVVVGVAAILWAIWKTRNTACFQSKLPTDPSHVVYMVCNWFEYWAGLQKEEMRA